MRSRRSTIGSDASAVERLHLGSNKRRRSGGLCSGLHRQIFRDEGNAITQGGALMVTSALGKLGTFERRCGALAGLRTLHLTCHLGLAIPHPMLDIDEYLILNERYCSI